MLAVALYPSDIADEDSYEELFEKNRKWQFRTFKTFMALDVAQTALRGQLLEPKYYLPFVLHSAALTAVGISVSKKRYLIFLAWYVLITLTLWSLVIRRFLGS